MKNFLITILFIFAQASFAFIEIDSEAPNFELTDTYGCLLYTSPSPRD